jgi:hypothetical protein
LDLPTNCGNRIFAVPQSVINGFGQMPVSGAVEADPFRAHGTLKGQTDTPKQRDTCVLAAIALDW